MTLSAPYQPHGRLKARPAAEIVEYVNDLMMRNSLPAFTGLIRYHLAYVVMLAACGVISSSTAGVLLRALRRLASKGTSALCLYPARYEELQPAIEAWLVDEVGVENGGQLNAGRSRQECQMVAEQLILRDDLLAVIEKALLLVPPGDKVISLEKNYEMGCVLKHVPRLLQSYREVNRSRAGVGSIVPTNLVVNRVLLAQLLGFDGCIQNSLYGYSAFNIEISLLNTLKLLAADLYRLALALGAAVSADEQKDMTNSIAFTMHEAQRLYVTASNLYLDTTPMIRGAITFSTHDCLLTLERIRAALVILGHALCFPCWRAPQVPRRPNQAARARTWERPLSPLVRCVASERTRLRRAEIELQRRVQRATHRRSPRPPGACARRGASRLSNKEQKRGSQT